MPPLPLPWRAQVSQEEQASPLPGHLFASSLNVDHLGIPQDPKVQKEGLLPSWRRRCLISDSDVFFPPLNCWEQIWKANNAMLSEGRYIGNRCSNSAWVYVLLWRLTSWLTSLPEAWPPNGCLVGIESQQSNRGQQPSELGTVKGQPLASPGSRQRPSGAASLDHGEGIACSLAVCEP